MKKIKTNLAIFFDNTVPFSLPRQGNKNSPSEQMSLQFQ